MNIPPINISLSALNPAFLAKVTLFLKECKQQGFDIFPTETFRTTERQKYLYGSGRPDYLVYGRSGPVVTWTLNSAHCKGLALDIAFHGANGLYPQDITLWQAVASIAKKYNIDWGYALWGTDKPHFQDNGIALPDQNSLTSYLMDTQTQSAVKNKILDGIASELSAVWNLMDDQKRPIIAQMKTQLLSYKDA